MDRLKEVVRLHRMGRSSWAIARQLRIGRNTIKSYLARHWREEGSWRAAWPRSPSWGSAYVLADS